MESAGAISPGGPAGPRPGLPSRAPRDFARHPARRAALTAGAGALCLLVTACKGITALGTPPKPARDVSVLREAIATEQLLIARYRAVLSRLPELESRLGPALAQHTAHLSSLRARLIDPRASGGARTQAARPAAPATTSQAISYLRGAETDAAQAFLAHLSAAPPSLAQLLASIAASEATHAAMLGAHGRIT